MQHVPLKFTVLNFAYIFEIYERTCGFMIWIREDVDIVFWIVCVDSEITRLKKQCCKGHCINIK